MNMQDKLLQDDIIRYSTSKRLTAHLVTSTLLGQVTEPYASSIQVEYAALEETIHSFDLIVWLGTLQRYVQAAKVKGHSMRDTQVEALLYAIAGRVMITLKGVAVDCDITVITAEDDKTPRMGMQSIYGTAENAQKLLHYMIDLAGKGQVHFQSDTEVNII
jgi:hypothetical protein